MSEISYEKLELPTNPVDIRESGFYELPRGRDKIPARVQYYNNYLSKDQADDLLQYFRYKLPWQQREGLNPNNQPYKEPRLTCWYGLPYTYSKVSWGGNEIWDPKLLELHKNVSETTKVEFNSVMCNLYRNGRDSIGWHSDDESSLGHYATISSISLGSVRPFEICLKSDRRLYPGQKPQPRFRFFLNHGSLLIMQGSMQEDWLHSVPKDFSDKIPRINLTFRVIVHPDDGSAISQPKTPDIRKYMHGLERTNPEFKSTHLDKSTISRRYHNRSPSNFDRGKIDSLSFNNNNSFKQSSDTKITKYFSKKQTNEVRNTDYVLMSDIRDAETDSYAIHHKIKKKDKYPSSSPVFHRSADYSSPKISTCKNGKNDSSTDRHQDESRRKHEDNRGNGKSVQLDSISRPHKSRKKDNEDDKVSYRDSMGHVVADSYHHSLSRKERSCDFQVSEDVKSLSHRKHTVLKSSKSYSIKESKNSPPHKKRRYSESLDSDSSERLSHHRPSPVRSRSDSSDTNERHKGLSSSHKDKKSKHDSRESKKSKHEDSRESKKSKHKDSRESKKSKHHDSRESKSTRDKYRDRKRRITESPDDRSKHRSYSQLVASTDSVDEDCNENIGKHKEDNQIERKLRKKNKKEKKSKTKESKKKKKKEKSKARSTEKEKGT